MDKTLEPLHIRACIEEIASREAINSKNYTWFAVAPVDNHAELNITCRPGKKYQKQFEKITQVEMQQKGPPKEYSVAKDGICNGASTSVVDSWEQLYEDSQAVLSQTQKKNTYNAASTSVVDITANSCCLRRQFSSKSNA